MTETHETLSGALAAFQRELPHIAKGNEAEVASERTGKSFKYKYADLSDVAAVVVPLLAKHGLSFSSRPTMTHDQGFVLLYELLHDNSDITIGGAYPLPNVAGSSPQQIGSAITYARRYALCAITGVAPGGDDDDAASAPTMSTRRDWLALARATKTEDDLRRVYESAERAGDLDAVLADGQTVGGALLALRETRRPLTRAPRDRAAVLDDDESEDTK